jgi:eukaryotic-like serine/threonine-protein kinase
LLDGRYEISGRLAQGGMAVVYSAFDTRLDRAVAVKVMHPALAADEDFVARFRREAKAAAKLSNPHVVSVTDQGRDGDVIFLVMELIEGRTLRELLREMGQLSPAQALEIMVPVLDALAAAHRAGLVHRDVKPENVLVADNGTVKVGDFGLARAVDASPLTATTGLLLGTVAYLAPEQVARGVADARADVYACGIMLFELLTGRPPFEGTSALQVAYQHLNENVPAPSRLVPDIPPAIDRLVAAATARNPEDRPHDATALLFRTRAVLERLEPAAPLAQPAAPVRHDTAPLGIDLADVELSDTESPDPGLRAFARPPRRPTAPLPRGANGIDAIVATLDDSYADLSADSDLTDIVGLADPGSPPKLSRRDRKAQKAGPAQQVKPKRRFMRPSRIVALVLVAASLIAALIGWRLAGQKVVVPSVVGKSPAAAQEQLRSAHLKPQLAAVPVYSETAKKGTVAGADPAPGRHAARGSLVTLKVSLGPERYTVPTVTGLKLSDAVSALRISHLHPATPTEAYSDTVPKGSVISIDPVAGRSVKRDTPVAIVMSNGPAPVTAPKVAGVPGNVALVALQKLGLKVTASQDFSETVYSGQAISITPSSGLHRMQAVKLSISKGPQLVQIPGQIEDWSPGYAKQYLQSLGLRVSEFKVPGLDSSILSVKPNPGSYVRLNSQVTIYLY